MLQTSWKLLKLCEYTTTQFRGCLMHRSFPTSNSCCCSRCTAVAQLRTRALYILPYILYMSAIVCFNVSHPREEAHSPSWPYRLSSSYVHRGSAGRAVHAQAASKSLPISRRTLSSLLRIHQSCMFNGCPRLLPRTRRFQLATHHVCTPFP
jgi:hypothetical protein